jgi:putative spermidine/putrescine transport system permease protein
MNRWLKGYLALATVFLLTPLVLVVVVSLSSARFVMFPPPGYSIRWFTQVLQDPSFMRPLWNSIQLGVTAAAIAAFLAVPAALVLVRRKLPGAALIQTFLLSPLALPSLVLAIALLFFLSAIGLGNTYFGLLVGHVVIVLPYLLRTVLAVYSSADPRIEEAAKTLGATPWRTFWHITLPTIRPGLFAGGMFAFLISFDEVAVALMLSNASNMTLPVSILGYLVNNYDPAVAAISVIKMVIVIVVLLVVEKLYGLGSLTLPHRGDSDKHG